ncbi:hypothetical protein [Sphaerotilus sp.]|jgi:hypothetical protein|uniref:hypothetical protein n=1 Tax=Sphaerotilus sp. TaxID=2093942 RepID=UPI00286DD840|nr:hypothetical protein [Sphaerotilus sp.]
MQVWSRITCGGRVVLPRVDGTDLIAQFRCREGHALLLGFDAPFEEALHLVYLDGQDRLRDEVRFSFARPEGVGIVTELRAESEDVLTFNFYGRWRVQVSAHAGLGVSRTPAGVYRLPGRLIGRHHLRVEALAV